MTPDPACLAVVFALHSLVVPAKAGTHTPCHLVAARSQRPSITTNAGGYGSLLSQGRRKRIRLSNNRHTFAPRGAMRPSCAFISRPKEGVGNAGCPLHPQPRVRSVESTRVFTTGPPGSPGIPARNGFNGFLRALPGDRACLPPSFADIGCLSPVGPTCLRKLDASVGASGPHDFAVRSIVSRQRAVNRSRIQRTRPAIPSRAKRCRVHRIPSQRS